MYSGRLGSQNPTIAHLYTSAYANEIGRKESSEREDTEKGAQSGSKERRFEEINYGQQEVR